jgi:GTP-binding protein HflX
MISLVGYSYAGKSSLFNALTQADVFVADQLFATLDPTVRQIELPDLGQALLTDTVGFIADLPHELIAAFKSTLEETRLADLLLHVVDISDPLWRQRIEDVQLVLTAIGAQSAQQLIVFNKVDQTPYRQDGFDETSRVWVSATTGQGIDELKRAISQSIGKAWVNTTVRLEPKEGALRSKLYSLNAVKDETTTSDGHMELKIRLQRDDYQRFFPGHIS